HEAAVDVDLGTAADGLHHLRQHADAALAVVELAPAVVRYVDALDAVPERDPGVLGGGDALEDERDLVLGLEAGHVGPGEAGLVVVVRPGAARGGLEAL